MPIESKVIETNRLLANTLTKSCLVSMHDSWKRKPGNGGKFIKFVISISSVPLHGPTVLQALQLLEYLIKHGSERVVDDSRSHISTLKMLRNFHYIDDKGKDEGINGLFSDLRNALSATNQATIVRNRSRELVELLSDVEKIRTERRKAKANKHKFTGTGHDGLGLSFNSGGSRFSGFGNDTYNGGGSYGTAGNTVGGCGSNLFARFRVLWCR